MAGIFISYRRSESRHAAGRLADDLAGAFGAEAIFRDIEGIDPGVDFTQALEKALAACNVMLVLIGPQWLDMADAQGRRRLDQPEDWIRQEIATALQRDVRVIPVLLEGAPMPDAARLPPDLQALVRRQALELADGRWKGDLQRLVETLARVPGLHRTGPAPAPVPPPAPPAPPPLPTPPTPPPSGKQGLWLGIALGAGGLLVLAAMFGDPEPAPDLPPEPDPVQAVPRGDAAVPAPADAGADGGEDLPDFRGLWRTASLETYTFQQNGANVRFLIHSNGQPFGQGAGRYADGVLNLTMTATLPQGPVTLDCTLQPTDGPAHWGGVCVGPFGSFPAEMFR